MLWMLGLMVVGGVALTSIIGYAGDTRARARRLVVQAQEKYLYEAGEADIRWRAQYGSAGPIAFSLPTGSVSGSATWAGNGTNASGTVTTTVEGRSRTRTVSTPGPFATGVTARLWTYVGGVGGRFSTPGPLRTERWSAINLNWGASGPVGMSADNFTAFVTGRLANPGVSSSLTFRANLDDDARLFIDDLLIGQHVSGGSGDRLLGGSAVRPNGSHLRVQYMERSSVARIELRWNTTWPAPAIPQDFLRPVPPEPPRSLALDLTNHFNIDIATGQNNWSDRTAGWDPVLPAETFPTFWSGASGFFRFGPATHGRMNAVRCEGQSIPLPNLEGVTGISVIAVANGASWTGPVQLVGDPMSVNFVLGGDAIGAAPIPGQRYGPFYDHVHRTADGLENGFMRITSVSGFAPIRALRLDLPNTPNLAILAITLRYD